MAMSQTGVFGTAFNSLVGAFGLVDKLPHHAVWDSSSKGVFGSAVRGVWFAMLQRLREKVLVITTLKNDLRKLKRKDLSDNVTLEMLKIDVEPIAPNLLNNSTAHSYYLRHTQDQAAILKEDDHAKACDYFASQPVLPIFHKNMNTTQAQHNALDDALVAPTDRLEFKKCNMRLKTDIKPKEATFEVVSDALALTPFYQPFLITTEEDFMFQIEYKDAKKTNKMSYPRFRKIIIDYFMSKDQSISRRNKIFWHTARDDIIFTSIRCISRHEDTQVYGTILPKELTNQAMLESNAYKTYYAFTSGEKTPKPKYIRKKAGSDTSPKQKPKKQPAKKPKAKGLTVLSEVALTEVEQLKLATKRSKTQFHSSHVSGSGDGVDTQSKVPDEQQQKSSGTDEGTGTIPGVPDVPIYESESEKESWGDNEDEDNENDSDDLSDEGDDTNDDDEETDSDRTESDRIKIPILDQSTTEYYEEEEENIDDEEMMYDDEDDEVTKELYDDVNANLGYEDTKMTNADQGASEQQNVSQESGFEQVEEDAHVTLTPVLDTQKADEPIQSSFVSSDFTSKLLNLKNPSPADNEIASLMETSACHAMADPENTSGFTTAIPPPPSFFNSLLQQATPTLTPTTSEATTSFPLLPDFSYVFRFNDRVTNLEKDLSEIKQVDQQEAQDEKNAYIELVDTSMRALIKEEVNTQLPQILPQAVSDFSNPVIEKNVTESVEFAVLTRSSSQPTSTYEAAASLSEFELTKILIDKMEKNKSYDKADYKKKLYDALVIYYNTDKDLFDSYGKVFSLKRS
ncbi:hypothetical protein Tco_0973673 [Tanacetum coccineum]